jgi:hypothetical protein
MWTGALTCGCCGIAWKAGAPPDAPGIWHARTDGGIVLVRVVRLDLIDEGKGTDLGLFVVAGPGSYVKPSEYDVDWLARA